MGNLTQKAQELRRSIPPERTAKGPEMKGELLGSVPHKEGQIRIVWDEFEGHSFLSVRLWTSEDGKNFWPSKVGFTVKPRDLPALGEAVEKALDRALQEVKKPRLLDATDKF